MKKRFIYYINAHPLEGGALIGLLLASIFNLALMSMTGCRHTANLHNPRVALAVTLLDASNVTVTVADGLTAADHALDALETAEPDYYAHVKPLLVKIAKANDKANIAIVAAKNGDTAANWKGALAQIALSVKPSDLTTFGFKNPNSQLAVNAGFATLIAVLGSIDQQFGGAK